MFKSYWKEYRICDVCNEKIVDQKDDRKRENNNKTLDKIKEVVKMKNEEMIEERSECKQRSERDIDLNQIIEKFEDKNKEIPREKDEQKRNLDYANIQDKITDELKIEKEERKRKDEFTDILNEFIIDSGIKKDKFLLKHTSDSYDETKLKILEEKDDNKREYKLVKKSTELIHNEQPNSIEIYDSLYKKSLIDAYTDASEYNLNIERLQERRNRLISYRNHLQDGHIEERNFVVCLDRNDRELKYETISGENLFQNLIPYDLRLPRGQTIDDLPKEVRKVLDRGLTRNDLFDVHMLPYLFPRLKTVHENRRQQVKNIQDSIDPFGPLNRYDSAVIDIGIGNLCIKFALNDFDIYDSLVDFRSNNAQYKYLSSLADIVSTLGIGLVKCASAIDDLHTMSSENIDFACKNWTRFTPKYERMINAMNQIYKIFPDQADRLTGLFHPGFLKEESNIVSGNHWRTMTDIEAMDLQVESEIKYGKDFRKSFFQFLREPQSAKFIEASGFLENMRILLGYSIYLPHNLSEPKSKVTGRTKWIYLEEILTGFLHANYPIATQFGVIVHSGIEQMTTIDRGNTLLKSLNIQNFLLMDALVNEMLTLFPNQNHRERLSVVNKFVKENIENPNLIWSSITEQGDIAKEHHFNPLQVFSSMQELKVFSGFRNLKELSDFLNSDFEDEVIYNVHNNAETKRSHIRSFASYPEREVINASSAHEYIGISGSGGQELTRRDIPVPPWEYHVRNDFNPKNETHWKLLPMLTIADNFFDRHYHIRILDSIYWKQPILGGPVYGGLKEAIGGTDLMYENLYAWPKILTALVSEGNLNPRRIRRYPITYIAEKNEFIPWYREECKNLSVFLNMDAYSIGYRSPHITKRQSHALELLERSNPKMNDFQILSQLHTDKVNKFSYDEKSNEIMIEFDHENSNPTNSLLSTWDKMTLGIKNEKGEWISNDTVVAYFMSVFGLEAAGQDEYNFIVRDHIDIRLHWVNYWYSGLLFLYEWLQKTVPGTDQTYHKYLYDIECPHFKSYIIAHPAFPRPKSGEYLEDIFLPLKQCQY